MSLVTDNLVYKHTAEHNYMVCVCRTCVMNNVYSDKSTSVVKGKACPSQCHTPILLLLPAPNSCKEEWKGICQYSCLLFLPPSTPARSSRLSALSPLSLRLFEENIANLACPPWCLEGIFIHKKLGCKLTGRMPTFVIFCTNQPHSSATKWLMQQLVKSLSFCRGSSNGW